MIKEKIEKISNITLKDFPDSDFQKVEDMLKEHTLVEVWLLKGMGRYYISSCLPNQNNWSLPIQQKLCELTSN